MDILLLGSAYILQKYHFTMQFLGMMLEKYVFIEALTPTYDTTHIYDIPFYMDMLLLGSACVLQKYTLQDMFR